MLPDGPLIRELPMPAVRTYATLALCLVLFTMGPLAACSQVPNGGQSPAGTTTSSTAASTGSGSAANAVPLAVAPVTVAGGGSVSADGVTLAVPAGVLSTDGTASITQTSDGAYDLSVSAPWSGQVSATVPLDGPDDLVVHYVDGAWTVESADFGDQTVSLTHTSPRSRPALDYAAYKSAR